MTSHTRRSLLPVIVGLLGFTLAVAQPALAQPRGYNYDEAKVPAYTLPDPLTMQDGTKVVDAATWEKKRRPEVLQLFKTHMFGEMPNGFDGVTVSVTRDDFTPLKPSKVKAVKRQVVFKLRPTDSDGKPHLVRLLLITPDPDAEGAPKPPYPAFLGYNFDGNHTVHADPGIKISNVWPRKKGSTPKKPGESDRGRKASRWDIETIVGAGYALATIYYGDVDPDFHDGFKDGIHRFFPQLQKKDGKPRGDNMTSIGGWAWFLSRALDYLEKEEAIDARRVAVFGHSRLGKTSLWAGATDPRFALVISNNSGCGGAALARRAFGETVKRINTSFPHWFCANHKQYNDNEAKLPIDQHMLIALMAPRPVYIASAEGDRWADPRGEFLSGKHASPVYKLYNKPAIPTDAKWPAVNKPLHTTIGYHVRTGKHDVTRYDWQQYVKFADKRMSR